MDKAQMVNLISERTGLSSDNVEKVLATLEDVSKNELASHSGGLGSTLANFFGLINSNSSDTTK